MATIEEVLLPYYRYENDLVKAILNKEKLTKFDGIAIKAIAEMSTTILCTHMLNVAAVSTSPITKLWVHRHIEEFRKMTNKHLLQDGTLLN